MLPTMVQNTQRHPFRMRVSIHFLALSSPQEQEIGSQNYKCVK